MVDNQQWIKLMELVFKMTNITCLLIWHHKINLPTESDPITNDCATECFSAITCNYLNVLIAVLGSGSDHKADHTFEWNLCDLIAGVPLI